MRLFIALDIPQETREKLSLLLKKLEPLARGARFVRTEGIHLTLKFIGQVEDAKVREIKNRLANVPQRSAIEVAFRNFGFFPNDRRPRVFWVGIECSKELSALASDVEEQLVPLGIEKETREFTPHLTLARFKTNEGLSEMQKVISSWPSRDFGETSTGEFHLYQSVLKSSGAVYTKIASYHFTK